MPRRLDSVDPGGYVEAIDVDDSELEAVVGMLGITDAQKSDTARHRIHSALEDFKTARSRTVKAMPIRQDHQDLKTLADATDPEWMSVRLRGAMDALESVRTENPVLYQRLKRLTRGWGGRDWITALQEIDEAVFAIGRVIEMGTSELVNEIGSEDGRGRPADRAATKFASSLYSIWIEFTGRPTSRQNAPDRQKDPFGEFVEDAGRLIFPDFKGRHVARQIHEVSRQPPGGEK
jgi:hypothetical protein